MSDAKIKRETKLTIIFKKLKQNYIIFIFFLNFFISFFFINKEN